MLSRAILVWSLFLSSTLFAIDGKIKVFIKSNDTIYSSQKVTISVELLTDAFSIADTQITFPASKKYMVQAPQSASYLGQEEVNGSDWQMVHYDYEAYALTSGKIEIPPLVVHFTASMGYGQPKKAFTLKSEPLHFNVQTPKGVDVDQFVLATDAYSLSSQLKPDNQQLIIGDAIELRITQKAHNVPDILLKPIRYASNTFLRVYEKEPLLTSGLNGKYDVSRVDSFTFVATTEGNVTLPAQKLLWWNTVTEKIEIAEIPAYAFKINPDPQIALDAKKAQEKERLILVLVVLMLLLLFYKIFGTKIKVYREERKRLYDQSEAGLFDVLLKSVKENDIQGIYKYLYRWLFSVDAKLARGGFATLIDKQPSFENSLHFLEESMIDRTQKFDTIAFRNELNKLRKTLLQKQINNSAGLPQTINPN